MRCDRHHLPGKPHVAGIVSAIVWSITGSGCVNGRISDPPPERPATTPIAPGVYEGDVECSATAEFFGETTQAPATSTAAQVEFDGAGFPLQNGQPVDIGDVRSSDFFGGTLQERIVEIRVDGDTLTVSRELTGSLPGNLTLTGRSLEEYRVDGDVVEASVVTTVSAGADVSLREACGGTLAPR